MEFQLFRAPPQANPDEMLGCGTEIGQCHIVAAQLALARASTRTS